MERNPSTPTEPFSTAEEVFSFFQGFINFEKKQKQTIREYRLYRMRYLLDLFEQPQRSLKIVHVAGSKGKGSISLYIAKALEALGEKTGLYSSPHVTDYRERLTYAGDFVPDRLIVDAGNRIREQLDRIRKHSLEGSKDPTTFELLTLLAFLVFRAGGCSYAVIETGIGGRLDATNVVEPTACVITPIELEHIDVLGTTLPQISFEKAGIIKRGVPVFISPQHPEAMEVLLRKAEEMEARVFEYATEVIDSTFVLRPGGTEVSAELRGFGHIQLSLGMLGGFQGENALLALSLIKKIMAPNRDEFLRIGEHFRSTRLPGRLEVMGKTPPFILDGAHTPTSVSLVMEAYREVYIDPPICIFGSILGKNAERMAELLGRHCEEILISRPGNFKPSKPEEVHHHFSKNFPRAELLPEAEEAFRRALELSAERENRPILVIGSFYMVAEIRPFVLAHCRSEAGEVQSIQSKRRGVELEGT